MDILDFFWTFYLNHLSPLQGYFYFWIETLLEIKIKKNLDIWGILEIFLEIYFENFV